MKQKSVKNITVEELQQIVKEVYSYNGDLEELYYYDNNEEFYEQFKDDPYRLSEMIFKGNYDFYNEYIKIDGFGNLITITQTEYNEELWKRRAIIVLTYNRLVKNNEL